MVGRPWLGNEVTQRGPILYVAAEGGETIAERLDAWCQQTGLVVAAARRTLRLSS